MILLVATFVSLADNSSLLEETIGIVRYFTTKISVSEESFNHIKYKGRRLQLNVGQCKPSKKKPQLQIE